jgi:flagellin-like hook-associated protein FlgL
VYINGPDFNRLLQQNIQSLTHLTQQLSTGKRVNQASDDVAGLQISTRLTSQENGTKQAIQNIQNGISLLQTTDGSLSTIQNMLQRIRELAVQGQNGTYTSDQKQSIQNEMQSLVNGINQIAKNTNFNGIGLLSGKSVNLSGVPTTQKVVINNIPVNTTPGAKTTVEFWMNWSGKDSVMPFGWNNAYDLYLSGGKFGFNTGQGNVYGISNNSNLKNTWVQVTAVFDNGVPNSNNNALYLNGEKQQISDQWTASPTTASDTVTSTAYIGDWGAVGKWLDSYDFSGQIDELKIWSGQRTDEQIQSDMYSTILSNDNNLLGYWNLNDSTLKDQTKNGNNGQLLNGASIVNNGVSQSISVHTGSEANSTNDMNLFAVSDQTLNLTNITLGDPDLLKKVDNAFNGISVQRGEIGAKINQYNYNIEAQQNILQNTEAANMRIQDLDMATASSEMTKEEIKMSTTTKMIAINNSNYEQKMKMLFS